MQSCLGMAWVVLQAGVFKAARGIFEPDQSSLSFSVPSICLNKYSYLFFSLPRC